MVPGDQNPEKKNPNIQEEVTPNPEIQNLKKLIPEATSGVDRIKTDIASLKKDAEALNAKRVDFEKNKNVLSKEILDQQQLDIVNEEKRLESKRQELLKLIKETKEELEELKGSLGETADTGELDRFEAEIKAIKITIEKKNRWEKSKDWAVEHKKPLLIAGGVVGGALLIGWIAGWFKKKKKTEGAEGEEKKGFRNHGFGKVLKWAGIGVAGFFGIRWLYNQFRKKEPNEGKDTEIPGLLRDTQNGVESFNAIPEATKESLNKVGNNVNDFYDYVYSFDGGKTIPAELVSEKLGAGQDKYAGVIPHVLDNTFENIGAMDSESGLFKVGAYGDANEIVKGFSEYLVKGTSNLTALMINSTLGIVGLPNVIGEKTKEGIEKKIQDFLTGKNNLDEVHLLYRKMFKTMAYLDYAENTYLGQRAEKLFLSGATLYKKSSDDEREAEDYDKDPESIKKLIKNVSEHPEEYKIGDVEVESMRVSDFRNKKIRDIAGLGFTTETIVKYSPGIKKNLDDLNKARQEKLNLLDKDPGKALDAMSNNAKSEMGDSFFKGLTKIIPSAHLLEIFGVGDEAAVKEKIMDHGGFKELLEQYKAEFAKMKANPDKVTIKNNIDKYYAQLKELTITTAGVYESQDENGNKWLHVGWSLVNVITGFATAPWTGVSMVIEGRNDIGNGKVGKGFGIMAGGAVLLSQFAGVPLLFTKYKKFGIKLMFRPIGLPAHYIKKATGPYMQVGLSKVMSPWMMEKALRLYRTPDAILEGLYRGMPSKTAFELFKMQSKVTTNAETAFMETVLHMEHAGGLEKEFAMMQDLLGNKRYGVIDQMMTKEGRLVTGTKKLNMKPGIDKMFPLYEMLKGKSKNAQEVGYSMLKKLSMKDWEKAQKLFADAEIMEGFKNISDKSDISRMTKALAKEIHTTSDVDAASIARCKGILQNKGINIASNLTSEQKAMSKSIEEGIASLKTRKSLIPKNSAGKQPQALVSFYERQINRLTKFESTLHELPEAEMKLFKSLEIKGLKVPHIVELLEYSKPRSNVEKAIISSSLDDLVNAVKEQKKMLGVAENLLEGDELIKGLRVISKLEVTKELPEIMKALKSVFNVLRRVAV